jgi:endonuclease YncB( thermonuclease family)
MQKPAEFREHPTPFLTAMQLGLYRAVGMEAHDGDTFTVMIDLGFFVYAFADIRLRGVDTPELAGPNRDGAWQAREFTQARVVRQPLLLKTVLTRTGNEVRTFERYVADVWYAPTITGDGLSLAQALLTATLAVVLA